ncbi:MAG: hypothetical protein K2N12_00325 [Helicobacter sp.]|nr:hypothetical protein [Helicobacter sp.]
MAQGQIQDIVLRLCAQAIKEAEPYILDYSETSIAVLDKVLHRHQKELQAHAHKDEETWQLTSMYGAYIGTMLLSNGLSQCGYAWKLTKENLLVLQSDARSLSPLAKVYHCLCNAEKIEAFYHGALALAREEGTKQGRL